MEVNNPLYKNQGVHVINAIFTVDRGVTKVLLIKRLNEPYKDFWALVGGALYNNEMLDDAVKREVFIKTGLNIDNSFLFDIFSDINRSPLMRMIAIGYISVVDASKIDVVKRTLKTSDASWMNIDDIPPLAYDHNLILEKAIEYLKLKIVSTNILSGIYPEGFTLPEIQKTYEAIFNKNFDRRNFRKKLLGLNLIYDTNTYRKFNGKKPAKVYKFIDDCVDKNIF